jgi:hypothetical protein
MAFAPCKTNIINEIMTAGAHGGDPVPVLDELTQLIRLYTPKEPTAQTERNTTLSSPLLSKLLPPDYTRKKSSFHLTEKVAGDLLIAMNFIRDQLPAGSKMQVSKSRIVEYALELLLEDFKEYGTNSILAKKILKEFTNTNDQQDPPENAEK